jgi:predicted GNAT superfamily acetyltransferase
MIAELSIGELGELAELRELADLFATVWGRPGAPPIGSDVLMALSHSGNYVSGARLRGALVGGLVGWFGGVPPHDLHLHSHILGVVPGSEARGVGFELKQHQRHWCLEREVKTIEWTTDPLIRRNAHFNLTKLGARVSRYLVNVYGEMTDGLNAGEESDRLVISWPLESDSARAASAGRLSEPSLDERRRAGAQVALSVGPQGEPVEAESVGRDRFPRVLLCQVPEDIVAVRRRAPSLARAWRLAVRRSFTASMARGFEVTGATRSGWYVLERPAE